MIPQNIKYYCLIIIFITVPACEKEVSVTPTVESYLEAGAFFINTNPIGADIWVDGKPSGYFTPDTVKWLKEGDHKIVLKTVLFNDHEFELLSKNNSVLNYYYDYFADPKNFGSILIESSPLGCTIFFNDSLLSENKTPYKVSSLLPDIYKIKVSYPEHRSDSLFVQVYGSKETLVTLNPIDTTRWVNYNRSNSEINDNVIYDLFIDESNLIWMGSRLGIIQLKGSNWNHFNYTNSLLPHVIINKIKKDIHNNYWIATLSGLVKIENDVWNPYTTENSKLPGNYVTDINFDNSGTIWIGTDTGLSKIEGDNWTTFNNSNSGLMGDFIKAIAVDKNDNSIWIGTNNSGIAHFDGIDKWQYFTKEPSSDNGTSLEKKAMQQLETNSNFGQPYIMGNSLSALAIDIDGTVWAGFSVKERKNDIIIPGGVQKYTGTEWETIEMGFSKVFVNDIYVTEENIKFVSTNSGLVRIKNSSVNIISTENSDLPSNRINAVFPDKSGTLWIATGDRGLVKYKNYKQN